MYQPVDCAVHSKYELAIMRQYRLQLAWHDDKQSFPLQEVTPTDLITQQGQEFLLVNDLADKQYMIRLDKILQTNIDDLIA